MEAVVYRQFSIGRDFLYLKVIEVQIALLYFHKLYSCSLILPKLVF